MEAGRPSGLLACCGGWPDLRAPDAHRDRLLVRPPVSPRLARICLRALTARCGERAQVFLLARVPLDTREELHDRVLGSLFRALARSAQAVPRIGRHWEVGCCALRRRARGCALSDAPARWSRAARAPLGCRRLDSRAATPPPTCATRACWGCCSCCTLQSATSACVSALRACASAHCPNVPHCSLSRSLPPLPPLPLPQLPSPPQLARALVRVSQSAEQRFPLMAASLGITLMCLQVRAASAPAAPTARGAHTTRRFRRCARVACTAKSTRATAC